MPLSAHAHADERTLGAQVDALRRTSTIASRASARFMGQRPEYLESPAFSSSHPRKAPTCTATAWPSRTNNVEGTPSSGTSPRNVAMYLPSMSKTSGYSTPALRNALCAYSGLTSLETPRTYTPFRRASRCSMGNSVLHGPHQLAQKLSSTGRPSFGCLIDVGVPSGKIIVRGVTGRHPDERSSACCSSAVWGAPAKHPLVSRPQSTATAASLTITSPRYATHRSSFI